MCVGVTGENMLLNPCYMSSSPAKVYLADICNWLTSLSGLLDKMLVFNLGKIFHEFFGSRRFFATGVHRYRANNFCTMASNYLRAIIAELLFCPPLWHLKC